MAQTGDLVTAARQLGYVMMLQPNAEEALAQLHQIVLSLAKAPDGLQRLRDIATNAPDSPRMLDELAWLLATYPDSNSRDGAEAVRLAERACALTDRRVPALLATLAAAYAETGDFSRGVAAGEEALSESAGHWRYRQRETERKHSDGASRRSSISPQAGAVADLSRLQNQRRLTSLARARSVKMIGSPGYGSASRMRASR